MIVLNFSFLYLQLIHKITSPTREWGPALDQYRTPPYSPLGDGLEASPVSGNEKANGVSDIPPSYVVSEKPGFANAGITNEGYDSSSSQVYPL